MISHFIWGCLKRSYHVTSKKLLFSKKIFIIYTQPFKAHIYVCILAYSASLLKVHGEVLKAVLDLFDFSFSLDPFLEMIGEIFHSYVKSKPIFKINFFSLSKLVEQAEIRLFYDFQVYTNLNYLNYKKINPII